MRIEKTILVRFNGDSDKAIECSIEYDDWEFIGTREECISHIEELFGEMEDEVGRFK